MGHSSMGRLGIGVPDSAYTRPICFMAKSPAFVRSAFGFLSLWHSSSTKVLNLPNSLCAY